MQQSALPTIRDSAGRDWTPGDEAIIPLDAIAPALVLAGATPGLSSVVVGVRGSSGTLTVRVEFELELPAESVLT
ncbi:hypothetical protein SE17_17135, partial [Kouleothrix aurantiaca]